MVIAFEVIGPAPFFLTFEWTREMTWYFFTLSFICFGVGFAFVVVSSSSLSSSSSSSSSSSRRSRKRRKKRRGKTGGKGHEKGLD